MALRDDRTRLLLGEERFERLCGAKILLLGVGGVGSFCLDCLYRSGVRDITIVDCDRFDITNQNRQLHSEAHEGEAKVHALHHHYPQIHPIHARITPEWIAAFDFSPYDLIIDAIDDMSAKIALIHANAPKLISSLGSAKRLDPTQITFTSIWKTQGDPFAAKVRASLRKSGFQGDFMCVSSNELPLTKDKGSFVGVTGAFGLALCALALRRLDTESTS